MANLVWTPTPKLLMLDEPVEGLAPISVEEILLVALNLEVCTPLTDRHYIIEQGANVHCA